MRAKLISQVDCDRVAAWRLVRRSSGLGEAGWPADRPGPVSARPMDLRGQASVYAGREGLSIMTFRLHAALRYVPLRRDILPLKETHARARPGLQLNYKYCSIGASPTVT